jgi:hypothetical protein
VCLWALRVTVVLSLAPMMHSWCARTQRGRLLDTNANKRGTLCFAGAGLSVADLKVMNVGTPGLWGS